MTDKAEDVVARLKSWATGSYDVELASARINVRDVRDALALIAAQAAEISALKAKLAHYTYKTDPYAPENKHQLDDMAEHIIAQAAEIAALKNELDRLTRGTWSLEIARRSLMTADLRAELAAAKEALKTSRASIDQMRERNAALEAELEKIADIVAKFREIAAGI